MVGSTSSTLLNSEMDFISPSPSNNEIQKIEEFMNFRSCKKEKCHIRKRKNGEMDTLYTTDAKKKMSHNIIIFIIIVGQHKERERTERYTCRGRDRERERGRVGREREREQWSKKSYSRVIILADLSHCQ